MDNVRSYFTNDRLAELLGMELVHVAPGEATVTMPVEERHLNSIRTAHGGALFSLADFTFAVASNSHGTVAVAISTSMSFVKAARAGVLTAKARETSLNPRLATYDVELTDEGGDTVALFHGMAYRKKETLEEARRAIESGG